MKATVLLGTIVLIGIAFAADYDTALTAPPKPADILMPVSRALLIPDVNDTVLMVRVAEEPLRPVFSGAQRKPLVCNDKRKGELCASWYGPRFHGRLTANGETYDMFQISAAHKDWRLGSVVKLSNRSGASIIARVNDRGPYIPGRDIDLSFEAARQLGVLGPGVAPLTYTILE